MIRAVIFDMDGILLDTEKIYCHFWMEAGREAGYDWKMEHSLMLRSMAPEFAEPMMKEVFGQDFDYAEQAQGVDGCLYGNASGREKAGC